MNKERKKLQEKDWSFRSDEWTLKTIREMFGFQEISRKFYSCTKCKKEMLSQTIGGRRVEWMCPICNGRAKERGR